MEKKDQLNSIDVKISQIKSKMNDPKLCDGTASTWTRISGYYRPVLAWNQGKKSEFSQRLEYNI